jgi:monoamine oxidase
MSRRQLFRLIGTAGGSAAMYYGMAQLGYAKESTYSGPVRLEGDAQGRSITILGAGLAGMTAALELRNAGYKVRILVNYNSYVHASGAFGGRPRRYREVEADFHGHVAELLAKATACCSAHTHSACPLSNLRHSRRKSA